MIQRSLEQEELSSQKGGGRKKSGREKRSKGKRGVEPPRGEGDKWELQFMSAEQVQLLHLSSNNVHILDLFVFQTFLSHCMFVVHVYLNFLWVRGCLFLVLSV